MLESSSLFFYADTRRDRLDHLQEMPLFAEIEVIPILRVQRHVWKGLVGFGCRIRTHDGYCWSVHHLYLVSPKSLSMKIDVQIVEECDLQWRTCWHRKVCAF